MTSRLFSTFDPANLGASLGLEQANTIVVTTATADINRAVRALYGKSGFQWFAEFASYGAATITGAVSYGVVNASASLATYVGGDANGYGYRAGDGKIYTNGASVATVTAAVHGDIIGVWVNIGDGSAATVTWFLNGVPQYTQALPNAGPWYLAATISSPTSDAMRAWVNTGQRDFEYPVAGVNGWYELPVEVDAVRVATDEFITPPDDPYPNTKWEGRIVDEGVELVSELKFWTDGNVRTTQGKAVSIPIANGDGRFDYLLETDIRDLNASLRTIYPGESLDDAENIARMLVNEVQAPDPTQIRITLDSSMSNFDSPLQTHIFPPSADPIVAGKPWPISLGAARQTTPTLVDPVNRIYAVHDRGVVGWGWVRDMGAPLDPNAFPPGYVIGSDFRTIVLETEPVGKLTADISSTGGGTLPGVLDDIWLSYGNPFTPDSSGDLVGFDQIDDAEYHATGRVWFTSTDLSAKAYIGLSTATCLEGRSYRYKFIITSMPGTHAYGRPTISLNTPSGTPMLVFTAAGTYEGILTAPYDFVPRLVFANALEFSIAVVSQAYLLEIPDTYTPANINAITLTDFIRELVEVRFGLSPESWSSADTEAIDATTGYAGIGFNATEAITVRDAIELAMSSYGCCAWIDEDNVLRFTRLTKPEDETPVGIITENDLLSEISVKADLAPGLTNQANYRRNWTILSETDFVTDFVTVPMATRRALGQKYQGIVASAIQLGAMYRHAVFAEPVGMLLDAEADAQAEIDRMVDYYSVPRFFYETEVSDEIPVRLGQIWALESDRYGLSAGKNLLVSRISRRPVAGSIAITLRG